jgi:hypothetical protein
MCLHTVNLCLPQSFYLKNVNCSKPGHQYNFTLTTKCHFNYHYFMGLFEFVHSEWICIILMTWFGTVYVFHKPQSDITCSKTYSLINMISYWNMRTYLALNTSEPRKTCTCPGRYAIYTCSIIYTWITLAFISETKTYNCHAGLAP